MKSFLLGILFLLWCFLGYLYHQEQVKCCAIANGNNSTSGIIDSGGMDDTKDMTTGTADNVAPTDERNNAGPILFNYANNEAVLGDEWSAYKSKLLDGLKDGERLEITGYYTKDEETPEGYANLGEARADAAREALNLSKDRVLLKGMLSDKGVDKDNPYNATSFKNIGKAKMIDESIPNKTIIRFPYNSTKKLSNSQVEAYLDKVAERVKKSGERVRLVGHTDSDGPNDSNMVLGQQRADIIKQYLIGKGVASNKILSSSKGETQPIASNSTSVGKAENRRTELEIIK